MSAAGVGMNGPHRGSERHGVLYVIACGSPLAGHVGRLVELAQQDGREVCVVTTPDGAKFVDRPALARQTGHPVRSRYKDPGDLDVLPPADAMIVCPATVNTVNKWAAGITDTLALGLLVEAQGKGVPIVAVPFTNAAMAGHPAFRASLTRLAEWGWTWSSVSTSCRCIHPAPASVTCTRSRGAPAWRRSAIGAARSPQPPDRGAGPPCRRIPLHPGPCPQPRP